MVGIYTQVQRDQSRLSFRWSSGTTNMHEADEPPSATLSMVF